MSATSLLTRSSLADPRNVRVQLLYYERVISGAIGKH